MFTLLLTSLLSIQAEAARKHTSRIPAHEIDLVFGLSNGGDSLGESVTVVSGSESTDYSISAGGRYFGMLYWNNNLQHNWGLRLGLGYHQDLLSATNGEISFSRNKLEIQPYVRLAQNFKFGLGISYDNNVVYKENYNDDVVEAEESIEFEDALGIITDINYTPVGKLLTLGIKYQVVEYKAKDTSESVNGNNTAFYIGFSF